MVRRVRSEMKVIWRENVEKLSIKIRHTYLPPALAILRWRKRRRKDLPPREGIPSFFSDPKYMRCTIPIVSPKHAVDVFERLDTACLINRMLTQHPACEP
jgi:hypothetical protein